MMKTIGIEKLSVMKIRQSEWNPRKRFPAEKLAELRQSMAHSGLIQPITVRPIGEAYEIVAGESRWRCARDLGWEMIDCVVREMDDSEMATLQMAENVARRELNAMEECNGVARMVSLGMTPDEVAVRLGVKARWVQGRLALGELPKAARQAVESETLSIAAAQVILRVAADDREEAVQDLLQFGDELNLAQVEDRLEERYFRPRENRRKWRAWCESVADEWAGRAEFLEDPESWAEYVQPYGKPLGKWKLSTEIIGAAAARPEDARVTWGQLAEGLGILGLLVPVGGVVDEKFGNVRLLIDGALVTQAEKAARKAGNPYTLGRREAGPAEGGPAEGAIEDAQEAEAEEELSVIEELRRERFNPWAIRQEMEKNGGMDAGVVAMCVLQVTDDMWREEVAYNLEVDDDDFDLLFAELSAVPWAVWWIMGTYAVDEDLELLAEKFGVAELWKGGAR